MRYTELGAGCDEMGRADCGGKLQVAVTLAEDVLVILHVPGLERAMREVLAEKDVQAGVDGLQGRVADEDDGLETAEDHADFGDGVPAVVTI